MVIDLNINKAALLIIWAYSHMFCCAFIACALCDDPYDSKWIIRLVNVLVDYYIA